MKNYFLTLICLGATVFSCTKNNQESKQDNNPDNLVDAPVITRIIDLPDSLKPKTVDLSKMPAPQRIIIPKPGSSPLLHTTPDGQVIEFKPPERKLLPAFEGKEEYIRYLKENNLFDSGKGGLPYYKAYTMDDGLAMNWVTCATVDKRGHIWFGTWGQGISRFDGLKFTNFSTVTGLPSNLVSSILEDRKGIIWIGTAGGGVSCYDGIKFTTYITEPGTTPYRRVKNMTEGKSGRIWINTEAGIQFYDPGKDSVINFDTTNPVLINYTFNCLKADKTGNLWIGTNNGVISLDPVNNQIINSFTTKNGLANNNVNFIHEDKKGKIWMATNNGISCYEPENNGKLTNYSTPLVNNTFISISEDSKGRLWFGTDDGGVIRFENNGIDSNFARLEVLNEYALLLITDSSDKLWFGTYNSGAICFSPPVLDESESIILYSSNQGLPSNYVSSIYKDKNDILWFGSDNTIRFDGVHFTYYTPEQGFPPIYVRFITEDRSGKIWFGGWGSYSGVYCYDPTTSGKGESITWYTNEQGFSGNFVSCAEESSGNIWFSSWDNGVFYFDGKTTVNYTINQGLGNNMIRKIVEDKTGNIWFATSGGGLSLFNPSNGGVFTSFSIDQGLAHGLVKSLTTDSQGNLWIATDNGLNFIGAEILEKIKNTPAFLYGQNGKIENIFKTFTTDDGLPLNLITNVTELRKGRMALGSSHGLTIFSFPVDSIENFNSLQNIETFNFQTGFPVRTIVDSDNSMFVDDDGILWIASLSEEAPLIRFDYDALHRNDKLPSVNIREVKINEEAIAFHTLANNNIQNNAGTLISTPVYFMDEMITYGKSLSKYERQNLWHKFKGLKFDGIRKFYNIPENLVLPYKHNRITIEFGTNELTRPQLVEYQYMLEGYDKEWGPVVKNTSATFGNIREGNYTFKVKAHYTGPSIQSADNWTEPLSYNFKVLPPWYRSWLAYIFYAVVLGLMVWQVHLFQKERTLRAEREKTQKRELEHAKEIEKAYQNLEVAHENLKATQSQLIQSEKMASLGELTAGIAHEIQNPLNFVNNFSEVNSELVGELKSERSKTKGERDETLEEELLDDIAQNTEKIKHHVKRASDIVKGMLQHSRTSSGQKEPTDINALADEYLRLSYHGLRAKDKSFNAEFKTDFDPNLPKINVVPQDIGRVLLNLINNAFYAAPLPPEGGFKNPNYIHKPTVTISTTSSKSPSGDLGVEIRIKDNGPGIPKKILDKIFQPFFTTKPSGQGTGLGLSLAYDIVKAHGGELKVEPKEGEGCEFIIQLPA